MDSLLKLSKMQVDILLCQRFTVQGGRNGVSIMNAKNNSYPSSDVYKKALAPTRCYFKGNKASRSHSLYKLDSKRNLLPVVLLVQKTVLWHFFGALFPYYYNLLSIEISNFSFANLSLSLVVN